VYWFSVNRKYSLRASGRLRNDDLGRAPFQHPHPFPQKDMACALPGADPVTSALPPAGRGKGAGGGAGPGGP
jgi:hypothetical protein